MERASENITNETPAIGGWLCVDRAAEFISCSAEVFLSFDIPACTMPDGTKRWATADIDAWMRASMIAAKPTSTPNQPEIDTKDKEMITRKLAPNGAWDSKENSNDNKTVAVVKSARLRYPPNGVWPPLMRADMAAAYVDAKSVDSFRAGVRNDELPRPSINGDGRGQKWAKRDLDEHIELTVPGHTSLLEMM